MDVFGIAAGAGGEFLRDAAIDAGYELGVFDALTEARTLDELADAIDVSRGRHRLRALVDVLVAIGALAREGDRVRRIVLPARPTVPRAGWGLMADVILHDKPLPVEGGEAERRLHVHLATAGAAAARELMARVAGASLVDFGGGAGAYTEAFLDAHGEARATLVDYREVVALARERLARFGDRIDYVASDIRSARLPARCDVALLANVLHLHDAATCAELCAVAARAVAPGGVVVIKDLRVDAGRGGPLEGLLFALNMAVYTGGGDVYETAQLREWLEDAGLVDIEERRLASSPNAVVVIGTRPASDAIADELDAELARAGDGLAFPRQLRRVLATAVAIERADGNRESEANLVRHYCVLMPEQRTAQLAAPQGNRDGAAAALVHAPLRWNRLPRLCDALDRLFRVLATAGVDTGVALGAPGVEQFKARTRTIAELYARTHYGGCMPLLYGYPADLAYFVSRGLSVDDTIDRYLTAPIIHELCHLDRDRDALPPHLDECIAGFLGVHVWPEFAYPEGEHDDAIYAAPWLSQVGQAMARVFGIDAVVRAHAGQRGALPTSFVVAARERYWTDWRARRTLHFLGNTLDPKPWLDLVFAARPLADDPDFDRAIVTDALRAMCLWNSQVAGSFRARTAVPPHPIVVDGQARVVTTAPRNALDYVAPSYWLPPAVAARLPASGYELTLATPAAIPDAAAAICDATGPAETSAFALRERVIP